MNIEPIYQWKQFLTRAPFSRLEIKVLIMVLDAVKWLNILLEKQFSCHLKNSSASIFSDIFSEPFILTCASVKNWELTSRHLRLTCKMKHFLWMFSHSRIWSIFQVNCISCCFQVNLVNISSITFDFFQKIDVQTRVNWLSQAYLCSFL